VLEQALVRHPADQELRMALDELSRKTALS
jgi:hypothetical protein